MLITVYEHILKKLQCCSITRQFYTVSANGMSCQFCGRHFNRGYNLRRHEKEYCPIREQGRYMSQTDSDSQERDFEDDVSTTSTQGCDISTDNKSETKEEMDPWLPLIEEAKQIINIKNARCATGIHNKVSETFSQSSTGKVILNHINYSTDVTTRTVVYNYNYNYNDMQYNNE